MKLLLPDAIDLNAAVQEVGRGEILMTGVIRTTLVIQSEIIHAREAEIDESHNPPKSKEISMIKNQIESVAKIYINSMKQASVALLKCWPIIPGSIGLYLLFMQMAFIVKGMGIVGGFIFRAFDGGLGLVVFKKDGIGPFVFGVKLLYLSKPLIA